MKQTQLINTFLDQSKHPVWMINLDFQLIYANKAYLDSTKNVTGEQRKLNESIFDESDNEVEIKKWKAHYSRAFKGEHFEIEEHFTDQDSNNTQYRQISFEPLIGDDGEVFAVSCQSKDLSLIKNPRSEAKQLIDSSLDVFCTIDEKGDFVYVSAASISLWGYSPEELVGKSYLGFVLEEDVAKTLEVAKTILSGKDTRSFTNRYRKKDGGISYNLWSVRWDNRTRLHYSVARDGWEKIEQEEELLRSEQRFKALVQEGYDLYAIIDLQGRYIYMSPSSTAIIGIPPEAFIGRDAFEFIHPEDMEKTRSSLKKVRTEGKVVMEHYRAKNQNDEWRWVETVLTNMLDNPAINGIVINSRDITDKIEQEEEIQLSQKRFESLVENGLDCVIIISPEGNTTYVSGSVKKVLGYSPADVMGIDFRELVHPEDIAGSENALLLSINYPGVPMKGYTSRVKHKNGSWRWIEPVITNLLHDPSVMGIVDNFRDITEQVQEQERLKLLESVITNTKDAVLITEAEPYDEPGPKIIYVNEAFTKMTGYEAEEVIGKSPRILQGPNSNKEDLSKLGRALRNWEHHETTILNYKKNGEEFWTNFTVMPVANEKGWYTHWVAIERDVTEQKNREIEKNLINTISDIFHQSIDNDLTLCLSNLCEHITQVGDFDIAEVWLPSIDDKSINRVAHYEKGKAGDVFFKLTKQITSCALGEGLPGYVWKNKKTEVWENVEGKWLAQRKLAAKKAGFEVMMGVPLKHKDEVIGVLLLGTIRTKSALTQFVDLLKKLELAIGSELSRKKIEIELAQIFAFTPDLICMAGFDGYIKRINPAGLALLGYSLEEIRSKPISSFLYEQDRFLTQEHQSKLHSGERLNNFENRYVTKEGKIIWLSWTATPSPDHEIVYAVAKDITEEKKLRELNRQVGELAKIGSWEVDLGKQSVFWSEEVHRLHETDPNSFVPSFEGSINFYRSDFHDMVRSTVEKCIATGKPYYIEAVLVTANQKEKWVRGTGSAEFIDGKCTRIFGSIQDIDDTKQSQIRLQSLASNLPGVIYQYIIKPDGTDSLKNVSEGSGRIWGFSSEEVLKNNQLVWDRIKVGGEFEKVRKSISDSIEFKTNWTCRFKYVMPSGELRTHLGNGTPTFLTDGTILFNSIILDITQEVKNEELLKEITDIARIGSWEMDLINQDGEYVYWSPILREIVEVDDSYDTTLTGGIEFHIGESKERIKKALELLITEGIEFDEEILLCTAKGNERWNRCIGKSEMVNGKRIRVYGSYQDIHERKIAEIAVRESEAKFRTIFEIASLGIAQVNPTNGRIILANSYYETITGYTLNELLKIDFPKLTHPDDREKDWELFSKAANGEEEYSNEKRYVRKDGSIVWVRIHLAFIRDETGKPIRTVAICEDISERKKTEQEKNSLQETIENSLNEIYIFDVDTLQFNYVNQGALHNLGYSKQEINTLTPLDLKPDYTETSFNQLIAPLKSNEKEKIVFFTNHKRKDGSLYPVEVHLQLVSDGNTKRFLAIILDITERKIAEESILQANERFEKVTEATHDAIWDWDIVGQTFYRSQAIERFFGKEASKSFTENDFWKDSFHPNDTNKIQNSVEKAIANPLTSRWELEYRIIKEQGETIHVIDRGVIIRNNEGKAIRMVGAMTDISEQKNMALKLNRLNKSLKQYTLELERSNEELEQFAYVASHDLQEPLRMVSSFMDLLKLKYGHKLDEKGLQYIYFATDGAKKMKKTILDLLEFSKATKHTDGIEAVNFNDVLSEFKQLRRKIIAEKSAIIKSNSLPSLTTYKAAIVQILHCLLDNALKYSKHNTPPIIEVNAIENETEWVFSIRDNGIGIETQFHEKIFIIFQRLHNKDKYSGTGIGLSIVKRQVEFLGGRIWLESVLGEGTVFYFSIPITN